MREIRLRYDGTLFGKYIWVDITPGEVYRALESENEGCYFIYDDFSIDTWGTRCALTPHSNCWFIDREESMHFTVVE